MAVLLVAMSVMAIMMTAMMPVWKQMAQREKEQELVFRGQQYARAIGLFQRKYANTPPPTLDVLVQEHFLRKKYKDPITNADFVPIPAAQAGAAAPGARRRAAAPAGPRRAGSRASRYLASPGVTAARGGIIGVDEREHGDVDSHLQRRHALQPVAVRLRARRRHARAAAPPGPPCPAHRRPAARAATRSARSAGWSVRPADRQAAAGRGPRPWGRPEDPPGRAVPAGPPGR